MSFLITSHRRRLFIAVLLSLFLVTTLVTHRRAQAAGLFAPLSQFAEHTKQNLAGWFRPTRNAASPVAVAPPMFATITVTNTNDSGAGSLRQAILDSNASVGTLDVIEFNLGAGTPTINLLSGLPDITDPVTINGNTGGATRVELNGAGAGVNTSGLLIRAGNSTVRSMVINRLPAGAGIALLENGGNTIENCYLGTDTTGTASPSTHYYGIYIGESSNNNVIGGTTPGARNVLSGNTRNPSDPSSGGYGVVIVSANNNQIKGNYIGTDATGMVELPNRGGVAIAAGDGNVIGGTAAGRGILFPATDQQQGLPLAVGQGERLTRSFREIILVSIVLVRLRCPTAERLVTGAITP